jgi:hypothetical protein
MRIKCKIVIGIDIQDCIGVYPYDDSLLNIIISKYEGRCFMGKYIEKVEKIVTKGECIINQQGAPSFGTSSIICEVTTIQYVPGEIVTGCIIQNVSKNGVLVGQTDIASILVKAHASIESVKSGQIISIVVGKSKYTTGAQKISINGAFYFPETTPIQRIVNPGADLEIMSDVLTRVAYEESKALQLKKDNTKAWEFFDQLLYAYNTKQNVSEKTMTMHELMNIKQPVTVIRDPRINFSSQVVIVKDTISTDDIIPVVNSMNPTQIMIELFESYCARLRVIREMITIYSTSESINDHKNIWQIIKKNKK